ncbi:MAG: hypothetical protein LBP37_05425, partial [Spirochaetaceae bacterium]|nr:hypothetical protein [Spirochaetaceae bacterium]
MADKLKKRFCFFPVFFLSWFLYGQERTLRELFPYTREAILDSARSGGYSRSIETADTPDPQAALTIKPLAEINMTPRLLASSPKYIIESLLVLKSDKRAKKLDVYNALRRISTLQGRKYFSGTRGKETVMFEDASMISGEDNFKKQKDPQYAVSVPSAETIFIMVDDVNFGKCYYRAEIKSNGAGIWYTLS